MGSSIGAGLGGQLHAGQLRGTLMQRAGLEACQGSRLGGGGPGSTGSNAAGGIRDGAVSSVSAVASAKVLASRRAQVLR